MSRATDRGTRRRFCCIGTARAGRSVPARILRRADSCRTCCLPESCLLPVMCGFSVWKTRHHTRERWRFMQQPETDFGTAPLCGRAALQRRVKTENINEGFSPLLPFRTLLPHCTESGSKNTFASSSADVRPLGRLPRLYSAIRFFHFRKSVMLCGSTRTSTRRKLASNKFIS
jgi:hypothetical protein